MPAHDSTVRDRKVPGGRSYDPRVDAYIEKAAPFAQPILQALRALVHDASEEIEETIKWGMPYFTYKGIICGMAAFTEHCAFGFWKDSLLFKDAEKSKEGMGSFGRITKVEDLPPRRQLLSYIRAAMKLNESGAKRVARRPMPRMPTYFSAALEANAKARNGFDTLSPSHKREYIEWLTDAKTDATRARRLASAIEWIAVGKARNWQYQKAATRVH
jgi:uncharacterized protein YdeI (YjbR/CyaY-like superfamily)